MVLPCKKLGEVCLYWETPLNTETWASFRVVPLLQHSHQCPQALYSCSQASPSSLGPQPNFRLHHFFLKYGCILLCCCWPVGFLLSLLNPFRGLFFSQHKNQSLAQILSESKEFLSVSITVFPEPITLHSRSSVNACWLNMHVSALSRTAA